MLISFFSRLLIIMFFYFFLVNVFAQTHKEIYYLSRNFQKEIEHERGYKKYRTNNKTMTQTIVSALFLFYKYFISSQDLPGICNFRPSCSEYAVLSIKKYGIIVGSLNAFDRLLRCNNLDTYLYKLDKNSGKYFDYP